MSNSVSNPVSALPEAHMESARGPLLQAGYSGTASQELSRSVRAYVVTGREPPSRPRVARPESVIGIDERVRILDTDLAPWRMICALRIHGAAGMAIGTGWLAGPRTIVTAGHCVHHASLGGNGWAQKIEVVPGLNGEERPRFGPLTSASGLSSKRFSAHGKWACTNGSGDFDVGCIHLDQPLGEEVGWFSYAAMTPAELSDFKVNIAGYPADRGAGRELYHNANRITEITDRRVHYEVDTYGGQSGSPVWVHDDKGAPPVVVGVHAYGVSTGFQVNSAPRIDSEIFDLIAGWVDAGHSADTKVS